MFEKTLNHFCFCNNDMFFLHFSITSPMGAPPPTNNWSAYGQPQQPAQMSNLPYPVQAPMGMPAYRPQF